MKTFLLIFAVVIGLWTWKAAQVSFVQNADGSTYVQSNGVWHYADNASGVVERRNP